MDCILSAWRSKPLIEKLGRRVALSLLILIQLYAVTSFSQVNQLVHIDSVNAYRSLGQELSLYTEESAPLSIYQIIDLDRTGVFVPVKKDVYTAIPESEGKWFKFQINKSITEPLWGNLETIHLRTLDFYAVAEDGTVLDSVKTGLARPMSQRAIDANTFFLPLYEKDETGLVTFYFRVTSYMPVELPLRIGTMETLLKRMRFSDLLAAGFTGLMLIMILYNIFLSISLRDRLYVLYTVHLTLSSVTILYVNNYAIYVNDAVTLWAHDLFHFWSTSNYIIVIIFAMLYLNMKQTLPKAQRMFLRLIPFFILIATTSIFYPIEIDLVHQAVSVIVQLTLMAVTNYLYFVKKHGSLAFTLGWTIGLMTVLLTMAAFEGLVPHIPIFRNSLFFGAAIETWLFSVALGSTVNAMRKRELALNVKLTKANEELTSSNESLDSFNYHVSHDLKTVLNNTQSLTLMLQKYIIKEDFSKHKQITDRLLNTAKEGLKTVESFLSISRTDAQLHTPEIEEINVVQELLQTLEVHHLKDSVTLNFGELQFDAVRMNGKAFDSLFLNLFTNAIKYNDQSPEVLVELIEERNFNMIRFTDNGIGIDLVENGDKLFKPFKRLENEKSVEGSGVGLYIVHRIVTSSDGTIGIDSIPGKGTTFTIRLPKSTGLKQALKP